MEKISTDQIVKIGIVVENIEEAVKHYAEIFNIEVPKVSVPKPDTQPDPRAYTIFRGEKRKVRCKTAIVPLKPIYIELIEPLNEPSPWNEFKEAHGQGVHYVAMNIEGFEEHIQLMEHKGMPVIQKTEKGKERYAYFDTVQKLGVTLEFKEVDKN
ncbi:MULTISPECIES: VOC family protein [unclassified Paenibacillus]|uniref:VOC family protein n=1 Tax=unclassified Paenibacillus TaxID=185978 RepID=UPI0036323AF7